MFEKRNKATRCRAALEFTLHTQNTQLKLN